MRSRTKTVIALAVVVVLSLVGFNWYRSSRACARRGAEFSARIESIKHEAHSRLHVGAKKDDVTRFFAEIGIPFTVYQDGDHFEAYGTAATSGCAPFGCGTDAALIRVQVGVDKVGTVISEPVVAGMYSNCL